MIGWTYNLHIYHAIIWRQMFSAALFDWPNSTFLCQIYLSSNSRLRSRLNGNVTCGENMITVKQINTESSYLVRWYISSSDWLNQGQMELSDPIWFFNVLSISTGIYTSFKRQIRIPPILSPPCWIPSKEVTSANFNGCFWSTIY